MEQPRGGGGEPPDPPIAAKHDNGEIDSEALSAILPNENAGLLVEWCEEVGKHVHVFRTAENQVTFGA
jgi:hypothetical protein